MGLNFIMCQCRQLDSEPDRWIYVNDIQIVWYFAFWFLLLAWRWRRETFSSSFLFHSVMLLVCLVVFFVFISFGEGSGLAVCCKPELQMVLERRKKEQTQREEGEQCRSPLEQVLLQRQQKQLEMTVSISLHPHSKWWNGDCYYRSIWGYTYIRNSKTVCPVVKNNIQVYCRLGFLKGSITGWKKSMPGCYRC